MRRKSRESLLSSQSTSGQSFLCSQPGHLSAAFNVKEDFFLARTKWVDKSKSQNICQRRSSQCETCIAKCGTDMMSGDPECSVSQSSEGDNGLSPRLMTCYNCCVKRQCSDDCKDYHKRRCQPQQCSKGNLLEFTMEASYESSRNGIFLCPITALSNQPLVSLNYTVHHTDIGEKLYRGSLNIHGDLEWQRSGLQETSDGVLSMVINSNLGKLPDFLEGDVARSSFKVGSYKTEGQKLEDAAIYENFVYLMPEVLGQVPPLPQSHQDCHNPGLQKMNLASKMSSAYVPYPDIEAVAIDDKAPFRITNRKSRPLVQAQLLKETRILQKMFPVATLVPGSFSGNVSQVKGSWVITVSARVERCPGYLHIQVKDPGYGSTSLFDCDTVVRCPSNFTLTFTLPTSDLEGMFKDVIVVIKDKYHVYNERVFRRSSLESKLEISHPKNSESENKVKEKIPVPFPIKEKTSMPTFDPVTTPDLPVPLPVLIAISGVVIVLLVLAILGTCFQPGVPNTPYAKWYHPIFAMVYMMMQFVYSLVVSGTAFFLILTVLTSEHVHFILKSGQQGAISTASSHIELLQLQRHLEAETRRQDRQLDDMQETCMAGVKVVINDLNKLHSELLNATQDVFHRHRLELLLDRQKLHVRDKLTQDLEKFRNNYATAAQAVLRQVNQNALSAYQNVEHNNTWLKGARFLHGTLSLMRSTHNKGVKSFMDWTGIKADLSKLEIDLAFSLPALPRLDDIPVAPVEPGIERVSGEQEKPEEIIRTIQMHNNWFLPLHQSGSGGAALFKSVGNKGSESVFHKTPTAFYIFLTLFILCDLILIAHRLVKAWATSKLIIFGFPEYFRERKEEEIEISGEADDNVYASRETTATQVRPNCKESDNFQLVKIFVTQTISTTFFPKIVFAVAACVMSICLLRLGNHYLTVKELGRIGFYHSADEYVDLQTLMTNARIQTHSHHINTVDFPAFQSLVSGHVARHRMVVDLYQKHMYGLQKLTKDIYCQHLKALGVDSNCSEEKNKNDGRKDSKQEILDNVEYFCKFYPVVPRLFKRVGEERRPVSEVQVAALLESVRFVIYYCCHLMVVYLSIVVLKELACAVVWILVERSGYVRLRIIVEQDHDISL